MHIFSWKDPGVMPVSPTLENLVIPRGFKSEFLTRGFSLQKSVEICSIMEKISWNGEAAGS